MGGPWVPEKDWREYMWKYMPPECTNPDTLEASDATYKTLVYIPSTSRDCLHLDGIRIETALQWGAQTTNKKYPSVRCSAFSRNNNDKFRSASQKIFPAPRSQPHPRSPTPPPSRSEYFILPRPRAFLPHQSSVDRGIRNQNSLDAPLNLILPSSSSSASSRRRRPPPPPELSLALRASSSRSFSSLALFRLSSSIAFSSSSCAAACSAASLFDCSSSSASSSSPCFRFFFFLSFLSFFSRCFRSFFSFFLLFLLSSSESDSPETETDLDRDRDPAGLTEAAGFLTTRRSSSSPELATTTGSTGASLPAVGSLEMARTWSNPDLVR
jgi:hypothetical protein